MDSVLAPVSVGELFDKISILEIKKEKIRDPSKLVLICEELKFLTEVTKQHLLTCPSDLYESLRATNLMLWDIEDEIRVKEASADFGKEFIKLARSVYVTNDKRFSIKNSINKYFGSRLQEVKEYVEY